MRNDSSKVVCPKCQWRGADNSCHIEEIPFTQTRFYCPSCYLRNSFILVNPDVAKEPVTYEKCSAHCQQLQTKMDELLAAMENAKPRETKCPRFDGQGAKPNCEKCAPTEKVAYFRSAKIAAYEKFKKHFSEIEPESLEEVFWFGWNRCAEAHATEKQMTKAEQGLFEQIIEAGRKRHWGVEWEILKPICTEFEIKLAEAKASADAKQVTIDALEGIVANLAAPIYSDEGAFAVTRYLHRANPNWAAEKLHEFALRAKAAIASDPEVK